jgi:lipoprotein-releasing system ATP-binding protein
LLDRVGLGHRIDHTPGQAQRGEGQRTAVVRASINNPALLLADEPTGALDRGSAGERTHPARRPSWNQTDGLALIVVTRSAELASRMGRAVELRDGQLFPLISTDSRP